jgi:hypothetical protein
VKVSGEAKNHILGRLGQRLAKEGPNGVVVPRALAVAGYVYRCGV